MKETLLCVFLVLGGEAARAANFDWQRGSDDPDVGIFIEGRIVDGDDEQFRKLVLELLNNGLFVASVTIYSPGGSVPTAINIGRQIRTLKASTAGPAHSYLLDDRLPTSKEVLCVRRLRDRDGKALPFRPADHWARNSRGVNFKNDDRCSCLSACFLIWAGGVGRSGDWIGLHRPYFERAEYGKLSIEDAERAYGVMVERVKSYLKEMEIPDSVMRKMMAASSDDMHFLSADEAIGLNNVNAALHELVMARCGSTKRLQKEWKVAVDGRDSRRMQVIF